LKKEDAPSQRNQSNLAVSSHAPEYMLLADCGSQQQLGNSASGPSATLESFLFKARRRNFSPPHAAERSRLAGLLAWDPLREMNHAPSFVCAVCGVQRRTRVQGSGSRWRRSGARAPNLERDLCGKHLVALPAFTESAKTHGQTHIIFQVAPRLSSTRNISYTSSLRCDLTVSATRYPCWDRYNLHGALVAWSIRKSHRLTAQDDTVHSIHFWPQSGENCVKFDLT
jgi:hypothetical protein